MSTFFNDLKFAFRQLSKSPYFTFAAVVILAISIGANTTIFSFYNALLLKPLPYRNADRIVSLSGYDMRTNSPSAVSPPDLQDWQQQNRSFDGIGAFWLKYFILSGGEEPMRYFGMDVSSDFFSVLGTTPCKGRIFSSDEYKGNSNNVAMLSYKVWSKQFGQRDDVIGKTVQLDGGPHVIIGVLPQSFQIFRGWNEPQIFRPMDVEALGWHRGRHSFRALALLKPGISIQQAQTDMTNITERLAEQYPNTNRHYRVNVEKHYGLIAPVGRVRTILTIQFAVVLLVLLIACANLANFMLVRAAAREKEIAVRASLGAGRWQIVRLLFSESLCLALLGAAGGILVSYYAIKLCDKIMVMGSFEKNTLQLDIKGLLFTLAVSLVAALVFGFVPALSTSNVRLNEALKDLGALAGSSRKRKMRSTLVATQIAISLILMICSGLLVKSLSKVWQQDMGYHTENILTMQISLTKAHYPKAKEQAQFFRSVMENIGVLPGVESASMTSCLPAYSMSRGFGIEVIGVEPAAPSEKRTTEICLVSPEFFETFGIPLKCGRLFNEHDHAEGRPVAIINETALRAYWREHDPIGSEVKVYGKRFEVIGAVADTKKSISFSKQTDPMIYFCYLQAQDWMGCQTMATAIRTLSKPETLIKPCIAAIRSLDSQQPITHVQTITQAVEAERGTYTMIVEVISIMGFFSFVLALFGSFSFMSYIVSLKIREIGIRMALGANRGTIIKDVLSQILRIVVLGTIAGIIGALATARGLDTLLIGVKTTDLMVFTAVSLLVIASTILACLHPACKASRINPMEALRYE